MKKFTYYSAEGFELFLRRLDAWEKFKYNYERRYSERVDKDENSIDCHEHIWNNFNHYGWVEDLFNESLNFCPIEGWEYWQLIQECYMSLIKKEEDIAHRKLYNKLNNLKSTT